MSFHTTIARLREASYAAPLASENPNTCRVGRQDLRTALHIIERLDADLRQAGTLVHGAVDAAAQPASAAIAGEAQAWMHENDPTRVISAQQKAQAERDGGAYASSLRPYTIPLSRDAAPQASSAPVAFSKDGVLFWYGDHAARRGFDGDLYLAPLASEAVRDVEDAERWRWATAIDENAQTLHSIVLCHGGDQQKINARADFYRAALSAQSVLSSGAPNGRKRTAAERRAPMVERVYGAGVTAQPAQKEQSE